MVNRAQEEVPDPQGGVAARLLGVLSEFIAPESLSFRGGTVLAARWRHRRSLVVDLFCEPGAYDGPGLAGRERLEAAIKAMPACRHTAAFRVFSSMRRAKSFQEQRSGAGSARLCVHRRLAGRLAARRCGR